MLIEPLVPALVRYIMVVYDEQRYAILLRVQKMQFVSERENFHH